MIKKRILFLPVLLIWIALVLQLAWQDLDVEAAVALGFDYGGAIVSGNSWRLAIGLSLVPFALDAVWSLRVLSRTILLVGGFAVLTTAWSVSTATSTIVSFDLILFTVVAALSFRYLGPSGLIRTLWLCAIAILLVSFALAVAGDGHAIMAGIHSGRWRGVFIHKNGFGAFLCSVVLLAMFAREHTGSSKLLHSCVLTLAGVCLAMALSATAIVAVAVAVGAGTVAKFQPRDIRNVIATYALFAVAAALGGTFVLSAIESLADVLGRDITLSGRTAFWAAVMPLTLATPFGHGIGTQGGEIALQAMQSATGLYNVRSTHSTYIQMALDIGWPATVIVGLWTLRKILPLGFPQALRPLIASFAALQFAGGLTETGFGIYPSLPFLVVLVLTCRGNASEETRATSDPPLRGSDRDRRMATIDR